MAKLTPARRRLIAWIGFGLATSLGAWKLDDTADKAADAAEQANQTADAVQEESVSRAYEQCLAANQSRVEIRQSFSDLIDLATPSNGPSPDQTPEEYAEQQARIQEFIDQFNERQANNLPVKDCEAERDEARRAIEAEAEPNEDLRGLES